MKTKNFPEKKRQRQLRALERRQRFMDMLAAHGGLRVAEKVTMDMEISSLIRATEHGSARFVRTKKDRSGTGRLSRNA